MSDTPIKEMSFEQAMAELESVITRLEGNQVALDDTISLSERGAQLKKHCEDKLRAAEEKIAKITLGSDGEPSGLKPLEG